MIKRVQIEGFKSFGKLDFEMKPLNVLIGPNGVGKTNFLDFFKFLREAANEELLGAYIARGGELGVLFKGRDAGKQRLDAVLEFKSLWIFPGVRGTYTLQLQPHPFGVSIEREQFDGSEDNRKLTVGRPETWNTPDHIRLRNRLAEIMPEGVGKQVLEISARPLPGVPQWPSDPQSRDRKVFSWVGETIRNWASYDPIDTTIDSAVRKPSLAQAGFNLKANGGNLTSVLHNLQNDPKGEETFRRIEETLRQLFPNFKRLLFPAEGGDGRLVLKWREGSFKQGDFSATFLSDGTLRFLCLLTVFLCSTPPPLVMIEEPELGLHPDMIHYVAALAQEASHRTQIIMTTHSPTLVSALKPEEVVVVEKEDGETKMRRLSDRAGLEGWLKDFSLGELWQMGEIGGRP